MNYYHLNVPLVETTSWEETYRAIDAGTNTRTAEYQQYGSTRQMNGVRKYGGTREGGHTYFANGDQFASMSYSGSESNSEKWHTDTGSGSRSNSGTQSISIAATGGATNTDGTTGLDGWTGKPDSSGSVPQGKYTTYAVGAGVANVPTTSTITRETNAKTSTTYSQGTKTRSATTYESTTITLTLDTYSTRNVTSTAALSHLTKENIAVWGNTTIWEETLVTNQATGYQKIGTFVSTKTETYDSNGSRYTTISVPSTTTASWTEIIIDTSVTILTLHGLYGSSTSQRYYCPYPPRFAQATVLILEDNETYYTLKDNVQYGDSIDASDFDKCYDSLVGPITKTITSWPRETFERTPLPDTWESASNTPDVTASTTIRKDANTSTTVQFSYYYLPPPTTDWPYWQTSTTESSVNVSTNAKPLQSDCIAAIGTILSTYIYDIDGQKLTGQYRTTATYNLQINRAGGANYGNLGAPIAYGTVEMSETYTDGQTWDGRSTTVKIKTEYGRSANSIISKHVVNNNGGGGIDNARSEYFWGWDVASNGTSYTSVVPKGSFTIDGLEDSDSISWTYAKLCANVWTPFPSVVTHGTGSISTTKSDGASTTTHASTYTRALIGGVFFSITSSSNSTSITVSTETTSFVADGSALEYLNRNFDNNISTNFVQRFYGNKYWYALEKALPNPTNIIPWGGYAHIEDKQTRALLAGFYDGSFVTSAQTFEGSKVENSYVEHRDLLYIVHWPHGYDYGYAAGFLK